MGSIEGGTRSPGFLRAWPDSGGSSCPLLLSIHSLGGLGRNIILTTMPAGTKLIAGNKPVSFLTAQQLQQLQQQGQATQVRPGRAVGHSGFSPLLCWPLPADEPVGNKLLTRRSLCKQVRIQTVPASHLQQGTASTSSKAVSKVVVTTAPSPKQAPEQQ